ncbi:MAG: serine/threonine protein kinase [Homavirus sp.]|uniref:Serine/threonine protein kinase n=1 Tax=Homavirus sp. TaxID=2487769 RepID=A0A3G5A7W3_9VIRU|nr:MAG: serine/threonine protein kinase [Homavirus sp.]
MISIGNYTLYTDKILGIGTFSKVYQGVYNGESKKNINNNTLVAIKMIKTYKLTSKAKKIIEDEINIMNLIKEDPHPNIVECYDVLRDNKKVYIILEYCDSKDLATIMKKPIKESYTQFYFSQLANGLRYLDGKNIIHRDIKPKNILLTNNRRVLKIADFGFARQAKHEDLHETICGSPLYMAPEITGSNSYNKQTDLWSIGMILYEMLYGHHPFNRCKTMDDLKYKIETTEIIIPPKENKNIDVNPDCLALLRQLLQKNVRYRITWEQFFSHPWINKYEYINITTNKKNENYKTQLCSTSMGSLGSDGCKTPVCSTSIETLGFNGSPRFNESPKFNGSPLYVGSMGSIGSISSAGSLSKRENNICKSQNIIVIENYLDNLSNKTVEHSDVDHSDIDHTDNADNADNADNVDNILSLTTKYHLC